MKWSLNFISEQDFFDHAEATIKQYGEKLESFDLKKFNKNTIDPIKLIFDKTVYDFTWEEIVKNEIFRQRDKSNNNDIGYFHQRIFQYIDNCEVPQTGWDVIFSKAGISIDGKDRVERVFVEIKNKHNTMNSSAAGKTYIKMQAKLLDDDNCACMLVEVIAKKSQNIPWVVSVDGQSKKHRRIRRVSIDKFYEMITGEKDAFYQVCMILPKVIEKIMALRKTDIISNDSVISELENIAQSQNISFALALYMLSFGNYEGFYIKENQ